MPSAISGRFISINSHSEAGQPFDVRKRLSPYEISEDPEQRAEDFRFSVSQKRAKVDDFV